MATRNDQAYRLSTGTPQTLQTPISQLLSSSRIDNEHETNLSLQKEVGEEKQPQQSYIEQRVKMKTALIHHRNYTSIQLTNRYQKTTITDAVLQARETNRWSSHSLRRSDHLHACFDPQPECHEICTKCQRRYNGKFSPKQRSATLTTSQHPYALPSPSYSSIQRHIRNKHSMCKLKSHQRRSKKAVARKQRQ